MAFPQKSESVLPESVPHPGGYLNFNPRQKSKSNSSSACQMIGAVTNYACIFLYLCYNFLDKIQKGDLLKAMDDGDSNPYTPNLYRIEVQAKRSPHLRM